MESTLQVLETLPAEVRPTSDDLDRPCAFMSTLRALDAFSDDFAVRTLAYGILWADDTARTTGTVSMALRRQGAWGAAWLVLKMHEAGITTAAQVPSWLNQNALTALGA